MREIPLYGGKAAGRVALVDDDDYELVMRYRWNVHERVRQGAHSLKKTGPYAFTVIVKDGRQKWITMHQVLTGYPMTDHIDHDGLNNQRSNLRPTNKSRNAANQRPRTDGSSRYKGVYLSKDGYWHARVQVDGKRVHLGRFSSEEEAARAYNRRMVEIHGAHAYLNLIPEAS